MQTSPKWGTPLLFNFAAKSFKIPFCTSTVAQSNILLVQGSPSCGDSVTYFKLLCSSDAVQNTKEVQKGAE